jgi:hypothetical protein
MTQNSKLSCLSVKQARVIPLILRARSVEAGCAEAGISKTLFYRWVKTPGFANEYRRQRDVLIDEAMDALKASVHKAVDTLTGLLESQNDIVRRGAANDILQHIWKVRELQDLENRLETVERLVLERKTYR